MLARLDRGGSAVRSPETIFDRIFEGDPFSEIASIRNTMNTLFDGVMRPATTTGAAWLPALDLYEHDGNFVVECALPGYRKDDIDIEIVDNRLTVSAKTSSQTESADENKRYHYREVRRGAFSRTIAFPSEIDASKVQASFENGVLKVSLPSSKPVQTTKVAIKG